MMLHFFIILLLFLTFEFCTDLLYILTIYITQNGIGSDYVEYHVSTICSGNPEEDYPAVRSAANVAYLVRAKAQVSRSLVLSK